LEARYWLRDLILSVLLAFVVVVFLYQPVQVEGTSMMPRLGNRERIFVNKFIYHSDPPWRHRGILVPEGSNEIVYQARDRPAG